MLMAMLLMAAVQEADQVEAVLSDYRALTTAIVHCRKPQSDDEIVVCSRRKADNYRVPLVLSGSSKNSVPLQTEALLDEHRPPCGEGAFLVRCGYVGVSVSTSGSGVNLVRREKAP